MSKIDLIDGFKVVSQNPLDSIKYSAKLATLLDLGEDNIRAYNYYEGLTVYCPEDDSEYRWRDISVVDKKYIQLGESFTYPEGIEANGIDYSGRSFAFFKILDKDTDVNTIVSEEVNNKLKDVNIEYQYSVDGSINWHSEYDKENDAYLRTKLNINNEWSVASKIGGEQGIQGVKGDKGEPGIKGDKGDPGIAGLNGKDGSDGAKGDRGDVGPEGKRGPQGDIGPAGKDGIDGIDGKDGAKGIKGDKGEPGIKGDTGEKGDTGAKGAQGLQGIQGIKGDKGEKGDTGATGLNGKDGIAGLNGKDGVAGVKGDKGEKGDKGDKGDTGSVGPKGDKGDTGVAGIDGRDGEKGEPGPQGIIGPAGIDGIDGKDGIDGERGLQGLQGEKGDQGIEGRTAYTHIAYADNILGAGMSFTDSNKAFIGLYYDFTEENSTDPLRYKWSKWKGEDGEDGDKGIPGTPGADGRTPYFHTAWATNSTGTSGFSTSASLGKTYMGTYTDYIEADSTDPSRYNWVLIKGEDGLQGLQGKDGKDGIPGKTSYTHIAYADTVAGAGLSLTDSSKPFIGIYSDFTEASSTTPSKYTWSKWQGKDGTDGIPGAKGADGKTPYFHTAWATNSTGTSGFSTSDSLGKTYMGTYSDFTQSDSTDPTKYKWVLIKGTDGLDGLQGPKGDQGIPGSKGTDGKTSYTHIAYADTASGGGFAQSPTNKAYIGMYVDFTVTDSTDPTKYKWSLIKGANGENGTPGKAGTDGRTPYFHTAWATNSTGTAGFSTTVSANKTYIGVYTDYIEADSTDATKYSWSLIKGTDGTNGIDGKTSYTHIAYADNSSGGGFSQSPVNKAYIGMYVDFIATDSTTPSMYKWSLIKGLDGANGTPGAKGADGRTPYLHIAYATNSTGTSGFSTTISAGKTYIGQYTDYIQEDSNTPSLYKWTLIKGANGTNGIDGKTSYTHIAYADNASGGGFSQSPGSKTYIGMYVDFVATDSTDPSKYKWSLIKGADGTQGIPGKAGADGKTPYFHTAWATNASGTSGFSTTVSTGKTHIGTYTDYVQADSTDPTKYKWSQIKGDKGDKGDTGSTGARGLQGLQGEKGDQGIAGVKGTDGKTSYTHIAYADTTSGGGFSQSPTNKAYIGMYVDFTAADSTSPSAYKWSLIKGADGAQGVAGKAGTDGRTPYFHTAWATNSNGTAGFSTTVSTGKTFIGTYTDFTQADSTNPALYKWSLIKGDKGDTGATGPKGNTGNTGATGPKGDKGDTGATGARGLQGLQGAKGDQGIAGTKGADGRTSYTHIAYADTSAGGGFSQVPGTKTYIGMYVDFVAADSTDPTKYKWSLIKGANGANGTPGAKGADGKTPYFHTAWATNSTGTAGFSTTVSTGKTYIGTYTDFTQADSTTPSLYKWSLIKGDKGDKGDTGAKGNTGSTGPKGDTGATGPKGNTGATGGKGDKGDVGARGPQGVSGLNGEPLGDGVDLFPDSDFRNGTNGIGTYAAGALTRVAKSADAPTRSTHMLRITNNGSNSNTDGRRAGCVQTVTARANAVYVHKIIAKFPVGHTLRQHNNAVGTGGVFTWLTSTAGTGRFQLYMYKLEAGSSGSFSTFGHLSWSGPAGTASAPVYYDIALATMYDMSIPDRRFDFLTTTIDGNSIATGTLRVGQGNVDTAGITGTRDTGASSNVAFWAGLSYENRKTAPYRVDTTGALYSSKAYIDGEIHATKGTVKGLLTMGNYAGINGAASALTDVVFFSGGGLGASGAHNFQVNRKGDVKVGGILDVGLTTFNTKITQEGIKVKHTSATSMSAIRSEYDNNNYVDLGVGVRNTAGSTGAGDHGLVIKRTDSLPNSGSRSGIEVIVTPPTTGPVEQNHALSMRGGGVHGNAMSLVTKSQATTHTAGLESMFINVISNSRTCKIYLPTGTNRWHGRIYTFMNAGQGYFEAYGGDASVYGHTTWFSNPGAYLGFSKWHTRCTVIYAQSTNTWYIKDILEY